jgi:hypothetical protein
VIGMLREAHMLDGATETDAYLRIAAQRYRLMRTHDWSDEILQRVRTDEGV